MSKIVPIQMLCPESKKSIKFPYSMTATRIVVHNTYNDASARNEISYMNSNDEKKSFHFAVDNVEVVQGLRLDVNGWHAGDGKYGKGNREGIGIEICYSESGGDRFNKAEDLAAKFIAQLLDERGWNINRVTKHQDYSGKYCPHRTLDLGWQRFLKKVSAALDALNETDNSSTNKPIDTQPKEEFNVAKTYRNGSTNETVYAQSNFTTKVGSLDKWEVCECLAKVGNAYLVKYKVNGTNSYKTGFVKYSGGVK